MHLLKQCPNWAVVTDFDGTVTTFDIGDAIALHFNVITQADIANFYNNVSVGEWMSAVFGKLNVSTPEIEKYIISNAAMREGFNNFTTQDIPLEIVSGGLDLYITPLLKYWNISHIKTFCGHAEPNKTGAGYRVSYPLEVEEFKARHVRLFQKKGYKVVFCGDGLSDFPAAKIADAVFARDKLYELCLKHNIPAHELKDFSKVTAFISDGNLCTPTY